jgi:hypothetical protein
MKTLVLLLAFAASVVVHAQDTQSNVTSVSAETPSASKKLLPDVNFLLNMIPIPLLSEGIGGTVEYKPLPYLSFWGTVERANESMDLNFNPLNSSFDVVNSDYEAGVRLYTTRERLVNFFAEVGYKWTSVATNYSPGLLSGVGASKTDYTSGPIAGGGMRLRWNRHRRFTMMADFELTYEPGLVKNVNYVGSDPGFLGPQSAYLDTRLGYGLVPKAQLGCNF